MYGNKTNVGEMIKIKIRIQKTMIDRQSVDKIKNSMKSKTLYSL